MLLLSAGSSNASGVVFRELGKSDILVGSSKLVLDGSTTSGAIQNSRGFAPPGAPIDLVFFSLYGMCIELYSREKASDSRNRGRYLVCGVFDEMYEFLN